MTSYLFLKKFVAFFLLLALGTPSSYGEKSNSTKNIKIKTKEKDLKTDKNHEKLKALQEMVFHGDKDSIKTPELLFQERIGDEKAPWVLIFYTSLSCEFCGELHKNISQKLINHPLILNKKLLVIFRDYPKDILSLYASCCLWGLGDGVQRPLMEKALFDALSSENSEEHWHLIGEGKKIENAELKIVEKTFKTILKPILGDNVEKIPDVLQNKELQKRIFDARIQQKKALAIENVPTGFLVHRKNSLTDITNWVLFNLDNELEHFPTFIIFLEKTLETEQ